MLNIERQVTELTVDEPGQLPADLIGSAEPLLLRGLVKHWPVVHAAKESHAAVEGYLRRFYEGAPVNAVYGKPEHRGRLFYDDDISGFNFKVIPSRLDKVLDDLKGQSHAEHPAGVYVGSTDVDKVLPGFRSENDIQVDGFDPLVFIWLGNRSRIAAHYDLPDNIACCVAGRRRFILFPPQAVPNLSARPEERSIFSATIWVGKRVSAPMSAPMATTPRLARTRAMPALSDRLSSRTR